MKFSTHEEIEAPIETVWGEVTDLRRFERKAEAKGAEVHRLSGEALDIGTSWTANFEYRGISRDMEAVVTGLEAPRMLEVDSSVGGLDAFLTLELSELSPEVTRLDLLVELRPTSMPGKMLIQTMRLAKGRLDKRFRKRVRRFAKGIGRLA